MNSTQNNEKHFVYFYFNRNDLEKIRLTVPAHEQYWKSANLRDYLGGPFGDLVGGLISFIALNLQEVTDIVLKDPFILEDLIEQKWIKQWDIK